MTNSNYIDYFIEDIKYCQKNDIEKLLLFVKGAHTLLEIQKYIKVNKLKIQVIGITFPANEIRYEEDENGDPKEYIPEASKGNGVADLLNAEGIPLIRSALPFEGIVIPGENYNPYGIVNMTFDLVFEGLANLIQSVMVATDNGIVKTSERIVVSNTAIFAEVNGVNSRMLFHPEIGLKIHNIVKKEGSDS